jgi:hypothetical protein
VYEVGPEVGDSPLDRPVCEWVADLRQPSQYRLAEDRIDLGRGRLSGGGPRQEPDVVTTLEQPLLEGAEDHLAAPERPGTAVHEQDPHAA